MTAHGAKLFLGRKMLLGTIVSIYHFFELCSATHFERRKWRLSGAVGFTATKQSSTLEVDT